MKNILVVFLLFLYADIFGQQSGGITLSALKTEIDQIVLNQKIQTLMAGTEMDLQTLILYYSTNTPKRDSIIQLATNRFPKGKIALMKAQTNLIREPNSNKQLDILKKLTNDFPGNNFEQLYFSVAVRFAQTKDIQKSLECIMPIQDNLLRIQAINICAELAKDYDLATALQMVQKEIQKLPVVNTNHKSIDSARTNSISQQSASYLSLCNLYGQLLMKKHNFAEALIYSRIAYLASIKRDGQLAADYGFLLSKNGHHQEALPILQASLEQGIVSAELKNALLTSYVKLNPGNDVNAYFANIEKHMDEKMRVKINESIIDELAPNFELRDVDGKTVLLSDFKSKIIVLDFWATWCAPCKKSLPAMQLVANMYKNDPKVKFLFIHTWERSNNPKEEAIQYLADNNFQLDLYMDTFDPNIQGNPVVKAFGVKSIPAKFVIDGRGRIRFKLSGFSGDDDAAVKELSAMINVLK